MRYFYILLNVIFITVISIASHSYFNQLDNNIPPEKNKSTTTSVVRAKQVIQLKAIKQLNANIAVQHNLFSPSRGEAKSEATGSNRLPRRGNYATQKFKLVGVFRFGKKHGAIIISSNQNRRSRSRSRQPIMNSKKTKRFYQLGDVLDNGYILKKVDTRTVLLSRGNESITLEMERNNAIIRTTTRPKRDTKRVSMNKTRPVSRYSTGRPRSSPLIIN